MPMYVIYLFRSGRVWIEGSYEGAPDPGVMLPDSPLLTATIEANSEIAALGKLLLTYVDRAAQPYQHIPICVEWCCDSDMACTVCDRTMSQHSPTLIADPQEHQYEAPAVSHP